MSMTVSELVLLAGRANDVLYDVSDGLPQGHPLRNDLVTIKSMVASLISKLDRANDIFVTQIPTEAVVPPAPPMYRSWDCT